MNDYQTLLNSGEIDIDGYRERISIEVQDLEPDEAQAEYDRRIREKAMESVAGQA